MPYKWLQVKGDPMVRGFIDHRAFFEKLDTFVTSSEEVPPPCSRDEGD
jgi:hypothetical protein